MPTVAFDGLDLVVDGGRKRIALKRATAMLFCYFDQRRGQLVPDADIVGLFRGKYTATSRNAREELSRLREVFAGLGFGSWWCRVPDQGWVYSPAAAPNESDSGGIIPQSGRWVQATPVKPGKIGPRDQFDFPVPDFRAIGEGEKSRRRLFGS